MGGYVEKKYNEAKSTVSDVVSDPGRAVLAVSTLGGSEVARGAGKEAIKAITPKMPEMPNIGGGEVEQVIDQTPIADAVAEDAPLAEQTTESKKRGRASTILTGSQGLMGEGRTSARRTLMGA